jgi:hypothetical protein
MSAPALHPPHRLRPAQVFASVSFAIMLAGWLAFAYALVVSREALADVWWSETARLIAIAAVALAYLLMFLPRERTP